MLSGDSNLKIVKYDTLDKATAQIDKFFASLK